MTDLKELFKAAVEIAQQVPENMQPTAFSRALDLLVGSSRGKRTKRKTNKKQSGEAEIAVRNETRTNASQARAKRTASGLQPKPAILWLIETGFLNSGKTVPDIQDHLRKKRAYDLAADPLSMALLRLVREGKLERDQNREGQYEYKTPT